MKVVVVAMFHIYNEFVEYCGLKGPVLLTWINFNPSMDKGITAILMCDMKLLICLCHSVTAVVYAKFENDWVTEKWVIGKRDCARFDI